MKPSKPINVPEPRGQVNRINSNKLYKEIADLMIHTWYFRVFVESTSKEDLTLQKLDGAMGKPSNLSDEMWEKVLATVELRKSQLHEYLNRWDSFFIPTSSRDMLKLLLTKLSREHHNQGSAPPSNKKQQDEQID